MTNDRLRRAARVIASGGVIAYATESVFGLGCDPRNRDAVMRLLRIKGRSPAKGLILIAADVAQLRPYVDEIPPQVLATWPGPHTWLVTPGASAPRWITGVHPRIAVRVTAHPQARALCLAAGMALVSTSANRSGQAPVRTYREAARRFGKSIDYILPGRVGGRRNPTPIQDAVSGKLVRRG
jgi:L-threonylcarbamoyladenylate synthase